MLLPPRIYATSQIPDKRTTNPESPFIKWPTQTPAQKLRAQKEARRMLLVHQTGSVKVGEVVRYTLTYTPSEDRILPSPPHLHIKIRNASAIPLRAAYLHGPYTLHVAAYPSTFNPNRKVEFPKKEGVPEFEPNLKAGGSWSCKVVVPEDIRESGGRTSVERTADGEPKSVTWIVEITSQIIFSQSASVNFELLVGRDERSLELGFAAVAGHHAQGAPGQVQDHQQGKNRREGRHPAQPKGIYSKAVKLVVDDTTSLWNKPALPEWHVEDEERRYSDDSVESKDMANKVKKQKNIHLVILTHGLHSNLGADMLYVKESIDATARQARMDARKRRRAERRQNSSEATVTQDQMDQEGEPKEDSKTSTAPLSGGQEDIDEDDAEDDNSDDEEVIVRGFGGNAVRTERGIQYLGKRMAKFVLQQTYPDQPYLPVKKTLKKKMSNTFLSQSTKDKEPEDGIPAHAGSSVHERVAQAKDDRLPYKYTSISFIGHSLGGLVQTYAVAYIHKHSPEFFQKIKPINFVCMASPLLGLSNENPVYVKFALDFGLVGRTGQDLGLTWRAPTIARSGWSAMVNGFSGGNQKDHDEEDPGAKPLLRILPTGPAHQVLRMFRNRTVYSNVVNDGIVPLRTSCLLFLDWRGLGRVEKARRENGLIGTLASFGFAELTGQNSSPNPSRLSIADGEYQQEDSGTSTPIGGDDDTTVPQPGENAAAMFDESQAAAEPAKDQFLSDNQRKTVQAEVPAKKSNASNSTAGSTSALTGFINYLKGATTTPKDRKMYKRSQTMNFDRNDESSDTGRESSSEQQQRPHGRPKATRGDSILDNPHNMEAPPKTTFFEAAGDIIKPPIPPTSWIIDPSRRSRTIFHDRVYHPEDIPPPPVKRPTRLGRSFSSTSADQTSINTTSTVESIDSGGMRVEEKIARAYHKDLSWRKVLVRLEPDAHNNICVRRMFANAYGWPVIKHLCDTHFADTWAARTRDEREPAVDRAKGLHTELTERGEEVLGQTTLKPPPRSQSEMREAADELAPLRGLTGGSSTVEPVHSSSSAAAESRPGFKREDTSLWDDAYFEGSDDEYDDESADDRGVFQRYFAPAQASTPKPAPKASASASAAAAPKSLHHRRQLSEMREEDEPAGTTKAEIADFLSASPPKVEGHRGLGVAPSPTPAATSTATSTSNPTSAPTPSTDGANDIGTGTGTGTGNAKAPKRSPTGASVPLPSAPGSPSTPSSSERPVSRGTAEVGLHRSVEALVRSPVAEGDEGVAEVVARSSMSGLGLPQGLGMSERGEEAEGKDEGSKGS